MAMIGRGAAIAEVGPHRHELHGVIAYSAWLGVHAALMTGVRTRVDAFIDVGLGRTSPATAARRCSTAPARRGSTGARTPRREPGRRMTQSLTLRCSRSPRSWARRGARWRSRWGSTSSWRRSAWRSRR